MGSKNCTGVPPDSFVALFIACCILRILNPSSSQTCIHDSSLCLNVLGISLPGHALDIFLHTLDTNLSEVSLSFEAPLSSPNTFRECLYNISPISSLCSS